MLKNKASAKSNESKFRKLLIIVSITVLLLVSFELAARVYIALSYGTQKAGISERNVNLQYRAFVMWGDDYNHRVEEFLNANRHRKKFTVLILGGSVAAGFVDYENHLINELMQVYADHERDIVVFNAAYGGYNSRQAAIALSLVSESLEPDLILVIDGYNDFSHALRSGVNPRTFFLDLTYKQFLTQPLLAPIFYLLQQSQLYNGMLRYYDKSIGKNQRDEQLVIAENHYYKARNFIESYAKGRKIPALFVLQPYIGFSDAGEDKTIRMRYQYKESALQDVIRRVGENSGHLRCFVNSNDELSLSRLSLGFSDDVHFKDHRGYYFLSAIISKKVNDCLKNSSRS